MNTSKNMTYRELLDTLRILSPDELNLNVTVFVRGVDEYYPVQSVQVSRGSDVLDDNHPYLVI